MASPAKAVNVRDPSGLRRFEDASAAEISKAIDKAIERVTGSLSSEPTAKEIQAAVEREASAFSAEARHLITKQLTETYARSMARSNQLIRAAGGSRLMAGLGDSRYPIQLPQDLRDRIEVGALANADKLSADLKARMTQSLLAGAEAADGIKAMKRRVIEDTGIDKVSAERIVRTEIMNAHRDVNEAQYARYGIQEERWYAAMDDRTCDECKDLHLRAERGETFPVGQRPHVHGGTDINCRCIMLPVVPEVKRDGE